jgi:hypothetical protein
VKGIKNMSTVGLVKGIFQRQARTTKCPGLALDLQPATVGRTLYTITGDPILVHYIFAVCSVDIGGGAATPFLQLTANAAYGAGVAPICALHASIAAVNAGQILQMTGVAAGILTTAAVPGIRSTNEATGIWASTYMILVPGIIQIVNATGAVSGVLDWYMKWEPTSDNCAVAVR